ncbi:MAG: helix-turn-helix transcriptional regulator [Akkermansia sp.]|nr:helix-turn-helix transcriptional regulator [Akkermansia sp.]
MSTHNQVQAEDMLPDEDICDLADFFKVFGDSSRLKVLWALHQGELCVTHLAELLKMSVPAVSHQLKILRHSRLVKTRREGKNIYYALADEHVLRILDLGLEHTYE